MKRFSVVEAMRAVASISVALFHICNQLHSAGAAYVAQYGWLGVDVFFVISGFVVPLSLSARDSYSLRDFPSFLLRRVVRLEPAYIASIALVVFLNYASSVAPGFAGKPPTFSYAQIAFHLFYLIPLTGYQWLSPVYWSLAYEFVFYLTVGISFGFLIKQRVTAMVLVALAACMVSFLIYGSVDTHIFEFLVGSLLMRLIVKTGGVAEIQIWLLISLVLVFYAGGVATGMAVSASACAILFLRSIDFGRTALFLGGISYSLYLVHVPIGGRVVNLAKRFGESPSYELLIVIAALAASLVAAMCLHRLVEAPSIKLSHRIGREPNSSPVEAR